ncbi:MAG: hypothetical protein P3X24_009020 [bacterium]|nr:hypothetical protein [bacterium]
MPITIENLEELEALLEQHPEWQERLAEKFLNERTLRRAFRSNPELKETMRREILGEELIRLPEIVRELVETVKAQTVRLERVEGRLERVEGRLERVEGRLEQVEGRLEQLEGRMERVEQGLEEVRAGQEELRREVKAINDWRRGETARREGELYEQKIVDRAMRIFGAGRGGSPRDPLVREKLFEWLAQVDMTDGDDDDDGDLFNPMLADLIWWKSSGLVALAEISIKVDWDDVQRALHRAQTLRKAGLDGIAVVIGSEWAHPETKSLAQQTGVEWRVGTDYSDGLKAFRKLT